MADITVTAANVKQVSGVPQTYTAGETITQGQPVYLDTNSKVQPGVCTAAATATVVGIALTGASADQPCIVLTSGEVNIGGTVVVGTSYVLSATNTNGKICPWSDLVSTNKVSFIGYGKTATNIALDIQNTGLAIP